MDPLAPLIQTLHADGRLRVWSLVITVFGDSVLHRGGQIAAVRLSRLLGRIGVENGAMRTALSRLARDGWVVGTRDGRTSRYGLTPQGLAQFGPATARIYAAPRAGPVQRWTFHTDPNIVGLAVAGGWLNPGQPGVEGFSVVGRLGPDSRAEVWQGIDPEHKTALTRLASDLTALASDNMDTLTALAARTLLIHRWRRLVLRWPEVPVELMPEGFHPADLHRAVADTYARLSPTAEAWLDADMRDMPAMPPADAGFANRFKGR
ncbi:MAG: PaaX family transcriptional regulator C-terminal domain-containing protein [Paracoccaceae bacterium]|nr:PaaX family transcriptional regulator C-terminal domain-containing protein [Paracoccaceae bacterium]